MATMPARIPLDQVIEQIAEKYNLYTFKVCRIAAQGNGNNSNKVNNKDNSKENNKEIDYVSIAFFCGLQAREVEMMHKHPERYVMGYRIAKAFSSAFGISAKQAFGFEAITRSQPATASNTRGLYLV